MEIKTLRKALTVGILAVSSGYATQASAVPSFTFTEYGGFVNEVAIADYSGLVVGALNVIPATPVYDKMSWVTGKTPQSSLQLSTVTGPAALPFATWTTISTLKRKFLMKNHSSNVVRARLQSQARWIATIL